VGSRVTVFWQKDQAWFHGVIEDTQGEGDLVMSKVQYDDGDVEVIDIFGGTHKVRLMQRPDGTPASDADEPLDAGSSLENDDGDPDGTEMPAGSRLRMRGTDGDARNDPSGKRGPGRPKGRPSGQNQSRRSAGKDTSPPQRAPGADPGLAGLTNELVKRRNPARVSAMEKMDTDGVHYDYGELPPEEEFPITDEKVLAVLAMIESNETARALADLPNDPEPSAEVFRLGYKVRPWGFPKSKHCLVSLCDYTGLKKEVTTYITSRLFAHTVRLKTDPFFSSSQDGRPTRVAVRRRCDRRGVREGAGTRFLGGRDRRGAR
jgi:hypothetical protein